MTADPRGYYACLEVDPIAPAAAITASYRRLARRLHPDVAGTGSTDAFIRLHEAYEVLGDEHRRAAYDRSAHDVASPFAAAPPPDDTMVEPPSGSSLLLHAAWLAAVGVLGIAGLVLAIRLLGDVGEAPPPPPTSTQVPLPRSAPPLAELKPAGTPDHYMTPQSGSATVWRYDPSRGYNVAIGTLAPFSPVEAGAQRDGMTEIRLAGGATGLVETRRLVPGDAAAARHAYCIDSAGAPPANGEILARQGTGSAQARIENHSELSTVVKLRGEDGASAATVFLAPNGRAQVNDLPPGLYRLDVAFGELWSRACGAFEAGMRAQHFGQPIDLTTQRDIGVPPGLSDGLAPVDIPDAEFQRD